MTNEDKRDLRRLMRAGDSRSDKEIAQEFECSPTTVKRYRRALAPPVKIEGQGQ